ncbi:ABC transporter ATP-binding protein [Dongia sp.]|uniref:ABC transporter ATP-binding protein n=1 Tax=Dongia sp. TaxID=1977262 RepID=UPI0035B01DD5
MASIVIDRAEKLFGSSKALAGVSLDIKSGEFVALVGPSGCGKTTLLRLIAGFERLDSGAITVGGATLSSGSHHVPTEERGIGMVFQSYALWPHMNVAENVAFALRVRGIAVPERKRLVEEALAMVGMSELGHRMPAALSGGQRQRVALARCMAMHPSVILLDEPLANLDVHLRESMQDEFRAFHARTGATMIYVTHDQSEALALADRVAVMMGGELRQVAAPAALYQEPADADVGRFIGRGMIVPCEILSVASDGTCRARIMDHETILRCPADLRPGIRRACLRAEALRFARHGEVGIPALVRSVTFQGANVAIDAAVSDIMLRAVVPAHQAAALDSEVTLVIEDGWVLPHT